jgi:hypothetical protein
MEGVNTNNFANKSASYSSSAPNSQQPTTSTKVKDNLSLGGSGNNLTDISDIANRVENSSPELRNDVIAKAQSLLNDPDWLSDSNLDRLATKISLEENL